MDTRYNSQRRYKIIYLNGVAVLFVLLFAYTATSKFLDYHQFVLQMELAPVPLMKSLAPILGWVLPTIEAFIASGFIIGIFVNRFLKYSLFISFFLIMAFDSYVAIMLVSGIHLPCTCGGVISKMSWKQHLLFNSVLLIISGISILTFKNLSHRNNKTSSDQKQHSRA